MGAEERRFRVMGCDAHLILVDPHPGAANSAIARLEQLEERWSRFLADSELSILNAAGGAWSPVSADTSVLIGAMQQASELTAGSYDPTFLFEVLETGYTQSLDDPTRVSVMVDLPCPGLSVHDAVVDHARSVARLPDGLALDAGGIGKGLAADLVVAELLAAGTLGALVSIGGDMSASGQPPTGDAWSIEVSDPHDPTTAVTQLMVSGGGIATSSTVKRRSVRSGVSQHHTIDPTTRRSSATDLAAVTVVANTGWEAEAHATAALIAGRDGLTAYLAPHGVTGFAVSHDRTETRTPDLGDGPTTHLSESSGQQ